jgi:hypothetical protein
MSFVQQLSDWGDKVKHRADEVVGDVVVQVAGALDRRSPVGDAAYWKHPAPKGYVGGRFRGNWQLGVDFRPSGETGRIDPTGATAQGAILAAIPEEAAGKVYYLMNNVDPYAVADRRRPWSARLRKGLIALTAIEFPQMVAQAVQGIAA